MRGDPHPLPGLRVTKDVKIFLGLEKLQLSISPVDLPCHKRVFLGCFASQSETHRGSVNHGKNCIKTAIISLFAFAITHA